MLKRVLDPVSALFLFTFTLVACSDRGEGVDDSTTDSGAASPADEASTPPPSPNTCAGVPARPGTVNTSGGAVTGAKSGATWAWRGIPYAAPPVGALRWRPPAPVACAEGERQAITLGPACPQAKEDGVVVGSEDCLTLNVWAPETAKDAPVLVFIHGGGNIQGTASDPLYDGTELAARTGSVVVTMNYRLGALGYLTHPSLDAERAERVSGNYGILDQVAALQWVKDNIAGFGGTAAKVLLFGESAGGQNTLVHIASPLSKGLFSAAIVESGGVYKTTAADARAAMQSVVDGVGCNAAADIPACLREQTPEKLIAVPHGHGPLDKAPLRYGPIIDGYVLQADALTVISKGEHNRVSFAIGTNADETSQMVPKVTTEAEYLAALQAQYGAFASALAAQYPVSRFASARKALIRVTTDITWTCPARRIARAAATNQTEPVRRYYFTWTPPGPAGPVVGATHGIELPFVFRTFSKLGAGGFTPSASDLALSESIQQHWRSLAAGEPDEAAWPAYSVATDPYLELGATSAAKQGLSTADCDVIESLVP